MHAPRPGSGMTCLPRVAPEHTAARLAWYSSMEVNSGLCREEMPSLRKMRPISNTRSRPPTWRRGWGEGAGVIGAARERAGGPAACPA